MAYDNGNIFAKILRGEIPCKTVLETEHSLAFEDISPQRPTHVLVIPKGGYTDFSEFAENASEAEIVDLVRTLGRVTREGGVADTGFRLIANNGVNGHQEVPHLHFHLVGGAPAGRMLARHEG